MSASLAAAVFGHGSAEPYDGDCYAGSQYRAGLACQANGLQSSAFNTASAPFSGEYARRVAEGMRNATPTVEQRKRNEATKFAAEIRARRPEMQVKKLDLLQGGQESIAVGSSPVTKKPTRENP